MKKNTLYRILYCAGLFIALMIVSVLCTFFLFEFIDVRGEWLIEKIVISIMSVLILTVTKEVYQS